MSSFPSFRLRLSNFAMLVAGIAALLASNTEARCDLIPTANGSVVASGASTPLPTFTDISAGTVNATSGLYDANSVLYLANTNGAAQTVTAQYVVNGSTAGQPLYTITLPASGVTTATQTVALPRQLNLSPGNNTVAVRH